jgi:hypothetical protein
MAFYGIWQCKATSSRDGYFACHAIRSLAAIRPCRQSPRQDPGSWTPKPARSLRLTLSKKSELSTAPRTETFNTTTFGNYEFRADTPSHEPLYGLLPLKFNGGYLALDILPFPSTGR